MLYERLESLKPLLARLSQLENDLRLALRNCRTPVPRAGADRKGRDGKFKIVGPKAAVGMSEVCD